MLLDIGVGILSSLLISHIISIPLTETFLFLGILFALSPDIDFLVAGKKMAGAAAHEHRSLFHYPLLFVPIGTALIAVFDPRLSLLFAITTFLHFIHDSIGIGWGVQWLYPFSKNHYAFLYQYQGPKEKMPKKLFYSWHHENIPALAKRYGDENWMRNIYLKFHPYAVAELSIFIAALIILWLYFA